MSSSSCWPLQIRILNSESAVEKCLSLKELTFNELLNFFTTMIIMKTTHGDKMLIFTFISSESASGNPDFLKKLAADTTVLQAPRLSVTNHISHYLTTKTINNPPGFYKSNENTN